MSSACGNQPAGQQQPAEQQQQQQQRPGLPAAPRPVRPTPISLPSGPQPQASEPLAGTPPRLEASKGSLTDELRRHLESHSSASQQQQQQSAGSLGGGLAGSAMTCLAEEALTLEQRWEQARAADAADWEERRAQQAREFELKQVLRQRKWELQRAEEARQWEQQRALQQALWQRWRLLQGQGTEPQEAEGLGQAAPALAPAPAPQRGRKRPAGGAALAPPTKEGRRGSSKRLALFEDGKSAPLQPMLSVGASSGCAFGSYCELSPLSSPPSSDAGPARQGAALLPRLPGGPPTVHLPGKEQQQTADQQRQQKQQTAEEKAAVAAPASTPAPPRSHLPKLPSLPFGSPPSPLVLGPAGLAAKASPCLVQLLLGSASPSLASADDNEHWLEGLLASPTPRWRDPA